MPLDPLRTPETLARRVRAASLGAVCTTVLFLSVLGMNVIQMASMVFLPFSRRIVRAANRWCADTWWGWCATTSVRIHGTRAVFTGDALPPGENVLLLSNHQSMSDIQTLFLLGQREDRLGDFKWFVKKQLRKVPGVGWGMVFLDCIFLERDWTSDKAKIRRTFARIVDDRVPIWLVTFAEGTRIRPAKLEGSRRFAEKAGLEPLRHLLLPRTKGFVASLEGLGGHLDSVLDVTIGYVGGVPSLWQWACGRMRDVHIDVRRFPVATLPTSDEGRADWLHARFREKDARLDRFYTTGRFV